MRKGACTHVRLTSMYCTADSLTFAHHRLSSRPFGVLLLCRGRQSSYIALLLLSMLLAASAARDTALRGIQLQPDVPASHQTGVATASKAAPGIPPKAGQQQQQHAAKMAIKIVPARQQAAPGFLGVSDATISKQAASQAPAFLGISDTAVGRQEPKQAAGHLESDSSISNSAGSQGSGPLQFDPAMGKHKGSQAPGFLGIDPTLNNQPSSNPTISKQATSVPTMSKQQASSKAPAPLEFDLAAGKHTGNKAPGFLGIDPNAGNEFDSKAPNTRATTGPVRQAPSRPHFPDAAAERPVSNRAPYGRGSEPQESEPSAGDSGFECTAGPCCDMNSHIFLPTGTPCAW
jgi:hypothetical protein